MFSVFFLLILMVSPLSNCLGRCATTQENKHLECTNLYDFPRGTDSIEALLIKNSTLIKIASNIFYHKQFTSLKVTILQYDKIEGIAKRAFNGLSSLILLDLTRNELEEVHISAFQGADALKILILTENRIRYLHEQAFAGLNNLMYLDLSHNNISHIPGPLLKYLPSLKYLDISFNPLNVSPPGSFLQSTSLAVLLISLRGLQEISKALFVDLPNLQVLDLSGSDLKVWPPHILYPLSKLRVLYSGTPLLVNEDTFVPRTVEKFVQSRMSVNSSNIVTEMLNSLNDLNVNIDNILVLQYLEDDIYEYNESEPGSLAKWKLTIIQKCLLFSLLVYLSFMYTMCLSQIVKSLVQKPYQRIYLDEI